MKRFWYAMASFALLGLGATSFQAAAGSAERKVEEKKMVLRVDDAKFELNLKDLKNGETRTYKQNGHTVTATRQGDELKVTLDGKPLPALRGGAEDAAMLECAPLAGEGGEGTKKVVVIKHKDGEQIDVRGGEALEEDLRLEDAEDLLMLAGEGAEVEELAGEDGVVRKRVVVKKGDGPADGEGTKVIVKCRKIEGENGTQVEKKVIKVIKVDEKADAKK